MNIGDIVEYQSDKDTEIGTIVDIGDEMVTVTYPDRTDVNRVIIKDRIIRVIKESGIN